MFFHAWVYDEGGKRTSPQAGDWLKVSSVNEGELFLERRPASVVIQVELERLQDLERAAAKEKT